MARWDLQHQPFPANGHGGWASGAQSTPGPTLEGVGITLTYYAGTFATAASLSGQPPLAGAPRRPRAPTRVLATFTRQRGLRLSQCAWRTSRSPRRHPLLPLSMRAEPTTAPRLPRPHTVAGCGLAIKPRRRRSKTIAPALTYYSGTFPQRGVIETARRRCQGAPIIAGTYTVTALHSPVHRTTTPRRTVLANFTINTARPLNVTAVGGTKVLRSGHRRKRHAVG